MIKFKLVVTRLVITLICTQFVATQSYDSAYEYDEVADNDEYSNFPSFGLRESSNTKATPVTYTRSHSQKIKVPAQQTTPHRSYTQRTTFSTTFLPTVHYEPTPRTQVIPTSSARSKLHEPGRILITNTEFVFANEIDQTKNLTTSVDVQHRLPEANDEIKSPSHFVETTYKVNHSPYEDSGAGYNHFHINNHNYNSKHLFSTDVSATKVHNSDGSGYFKTAGKYDLSKLSNRYNTFPIHEKLKTDLALADLQLQSFPRPLKNFKHQHLPHTYSYTTEKLAVKSAATREQIKLYNDDVKKYYDQLLGEQLRTSKDPADKAKYHQFIKAMEDEKIEQQSTSIRDLKRQRPIVAPSRPRPFTASHETRIQTPEKTLGLGFYKFSGSPFTERPYKFPFL